jgi:hypothetical protein
MLLTNLKIVLVRLQFLGHAMAYPDCFTPSFTTRPSPLLISRHFLNYR